jgi:hypothetical protein
MLFATMTRIRCKTANPGHSAPFKRTEQTLPGLVEPDRTASPFDKQPCHEVEAFGRGQPFKRFHVRRERGDAVIMMSRVIVVLRLRRVSCCIPAAMVIAERTRRAANHRRPIRVYPNFLFQQVSPA